MTTRFGFTTGAAGVAADAVARGLKRSLAVDSSIAVPGDNSSSLIENGYGPEFKFKRAKGIGGLVVSGAADFLEISAQPLQADIVRVENLVNDEVERATEADVQINQALTDESIARGTEIKAEADRALAAEQGLQTQISNLLDNTDGVALNSLAELVADYRDNGPDLLNAFKTTTQSAISTAQSDISTAAGYIATLQGDTAYQYEQIVELQEDVIPELQGQVSGVQSDVEVLFGEVNRVEEKTHTYLQPVFLTDASNTDLGSAEPVDAKIRVYKTMHKVTLVIDAFAVNVTANNVHGLRLGPGPYNASPRVPDGAEDPDQSTIHFPELNEPGDAPSYWWPQYSSYDEGGASYVLMRSAFIVIVQPDVEPVVEMGTLLIGSQGELLLKRDSTPFPQGASVGLAGRQEFTFHNI